MSIETKATIYNDMSGFAEMRRNARDNPDVALRQVAEQFEAIFMQMMLKSMRSASMGNSLFDSDQSKMYQDMFDNQLSLSLSKGQENGLADILVRQLSGTIANTTDEKIELEKLELPIAQTKQQRFINIVRPYAEKAATRLGTEPDILIAQAALETGWGQAVQRHNDGSSGFNLFNIKANNHWQGPIVSKNTVEYKNGIAVREHSKFRAYNSIDESFNDYVNFLQSSSRYDQVLKTPHDARAYITGLANSGYATDPAYANKIMNIMQRDVSPHINADKNKILPKESD